MQIHEVSATTSAPECVLEAHEISSSNTDVCGQFTDQSKHYMDVLGDVTLVDTPLEVYNHPPAVAD